MSSTRGCVKFSPILWGNAMVCGAFLSLSECPQMHSELLRAWKNEACERCVDSQAGVHTAQVQTEDDATGPAATRPLR